MQPRDFNGCGFAAATQMKRVAWRRVGQWLTALLLGVATCVQAASTVVDDRGRAVVTAAAPQRIVSLLPSLTETVCALNACDRLVGVDRFSNWPAAITSKLFNVGGGLDPNIEAIVALRPDVVLLSNNAKVIERLEQLGIRTVALEPRTQADVLHVMQVVAAVLHLPAAQSANALWQRMQQGIAQAAASVPAQARGATVYFEVSRGPYVAGPQSFLGELLTSMGMRNVVPAEMGDFPRVSAEFVVRAQPDVLLMGSHSMQVADGYPGWSSLRAVREQRVCGFSEEESAILVRPGPRMDESARLLARCLRDKAPRRSERAH